ncbi:unnamed protein product, partial [Ixodes pacificus]
VFVCVVCACVRFLLRCWLCALFRSYIYIYILSRRRSKKGPTHKSTGAFNQTQFHEFLMFVRL